MLLWMLMWNAGGLCGQLLLLLVLVLLQLQLLKLMLRACCCSCIRRYGFHLINLQLIIYSYSQQYFFSILSPWQFTVFLRTY